MSVSPDETASPQTTQNSSAPAPDANSVSPTRQALLKASQPLRRDRRRRGSLQEPPAGAAVESGLKANPLRRRRGSLQDGAAVGAPAESAPWLPAGRHTAKTRWQAEMARAQTASGAPRRARRKSLPDVLATKLPPTSPPLELENMDFSNIDALKAARDKYQVCCPLPVLSNLDTLPQLTVADADEALKQGKFEEVRGCAAAVCGLLMMVQAVSLLSDAISADPGNPDNFSKRSSALSQLRDFEVLSPPLKLHTEIQMQNAYSDAKQALSLIPGDSNDRIRPLVRQAQALEGLKKNKQAVQCYQVNT